MGQAERATAEFIEEAMADEKVAVDEQIESLARKMDSLPQDEGGATMPQPMQRPIRQIALGDLKPHPLQSSLFAPPTDAEIADLANDMGTRGLQIPIEITENSVVICGHRRLRAAKLLGWTTIAAVVRHDLRTDAEIERHLIADNSRRRQMTPLERARCAYRLRELYPDRAFDATAEAEIEPEAAIRKRFQAAGVKGEALKKAVLAAQKSNEEAGRQAAARHGTQAWIAGMLRVSQSTASRMLAIMELPREIQQAFDDHRISLALAAKVAKLRTDYQAEIAVEIEAGGNPREIAEKYCSDCSQQTAGAAVYRRLIRALRDANEIFADGFEDVPGGEEGALDALHQATPMLAGLVAHVADQEADGKEALADTLNNITQLLQASKGMGLHVEALSG